VFRKDNFLNIGLGREDPNDLKHHLNDFVAKMQAEERIPEDLPGKFKGHAYLLYDHAERPLVDDGILLIGDSAGLAYTQSGEGIRPAVESAFLATEVIQDAPDYSAASLQPYADRLRERFGTREVEREGGVDIPDWAKLRIAPALMKTHWFTRRVVTERWFLHEHVPALEVAS
ncbi:MAG: NAD(P)/FAD-dependent oxidoreductase, partial [Pseudomonadota bacterium]